MHTIKSKPIQIPYCFEQEKLKSSIDSMIDIIIANEAKGYLVRGCVEDIVEALTFSSFNSTIALINRDLSQQFDASLYSFSQETQQQSTARAIH